MRNTHRYFGAGVVALALGSLAGLGGGIFPAHADAVSDQAVFVARINGLRASKGLGSLTVDPRLVGVASGWAAHLAASGVLAHNPSLAAQGPAGWTVLGENVGEGSSVDLLQAAFVASPEHYANMVDSRFTSIGVGVVVANGVTWVTEDYMANGLAPQPPAPPAPAPVRPAPPAPKPAPRPVAPVTAPAVTTAPAAAAPPPASPVVTAPTPPADTSAQITRLLEQLQHLDSWL